MFILLVKKRIGLFKEYVSKILDVKVEVNIMEFFVGIIKC